MTPDLFSLRELGGVWARDYWTITSSLHNCLFSLFLDDFRIFVGDIGNDVNDDTLTRAFSKYPSFLKAKVIRERQTKKTKGYGFVSFKDPHDFMQAMREMNGNLHSFIHQSVVIDCYSLVPRPSITANRVEGLVKLLCRMTSGGCLVDVWWTFGGVVVLLNREPEK